MSVTHAIQFSFGLSSYCEAKLCAQKYGPENTRLVFCDTQSEDADTYRWGAHAALAVFGLPPPSGVLRVLSDTLPPTPETDEQEAAFRRQVVLLLDETCRVCPGLTVLRDGRTVWEVFRDERYLGNSRKDPCSKILKRQLADSWRSSQFTPQEVVVHVGIHWSEKERLDKIRPRLAPYQVQALLAEDRPILSAADMKAMAAADGLWEQDLYRAGMTHANCAGACVKAGHAHWSLLLKTRPGVYARAERKEQEMRDFLGKDVTILRDRTGGKVRPMTLKEFRERTQAGWQCDPFDFGGCGCFTTTPEDNPPPHEDPP